MDKRRAIQIITRAAALYHVNLEDQKVIFLYGVPAEVRKELQAEKGKLLSIKSYEVAFHRYNFLHLTGVRINSPDVASAIHFYEKCLDNRLIPENFSFAKDGSTVQKLDILENMMEIKQNVTMIGDFTNRGSKLFTEKAAGSICGCIGFVKDRNTKLNVPNTLLKKDIRDVIASPVQKVYAVLSKSYTAERYSFLEKVGKGINIKKCFFTEEIEKLLDRQVF
ncbi:MAG: PBECR4 domain-containing protein [Eubacterium sp.]|nr:PBECR4 domain-containing protein [Eubacterium sp.]